MISKIIVAACTALAAASVSAQTQQTIPITGSATVSIPAAIPGPAGPQGPAGVSPSLSSIEAALAADQNFVKAVAAAMGGTTPPPPPPPPPTSNACSATSGTLSLNAKAVRASGISPFLSFFDATGTTDTSISNGMTPFQDLDYSWSFADPKGGVWPFGSNKGSNSRNSASGGVAAHLYIASADTTYPVTVTATNPMTGAKASCQIAVMAYNPAGAKGFGQTTCVANALPIAGHGGCPLASATAAASTFNTALSLSMNGRRVLFHCGDTFSGDNATLNGSTWSIGAYGGCEGTQTGRPVFKPGPIGALIVGATSGDGRISDIEFQGGNAAVTTGGGNTKINYQITLSNLLSNGQNTSFSYSQGAQWAIVDSVQASATGIGVFMNFNENNPATWSGNPFNNLDYQALLGNSINGVGCCSASSGIETVRFSAGRLFLIENNNIQNSNNIGSNLKLHNGNTNGSVATWSGVYTELFMITDNWFGLNGGAGPEIAPQNGGLDERIRNGVIERNMITNQTPAQGGRQGYLSGQNLTFRNNVSTLPGTTAIYPIIGMQVMVRGPGFPATWPSKNIEIYNNTCYAPNNVNNVQYCIGNDTIGQELPAINSIFKNNLYYKPSANNSAVDNTGAANTVSNNTSNSTLNPGFVNASGTFSLMSDFKPTTNYAGGVAVPVLTDATGSALTNPPDLGAIRH